MCVLPVLLLVTSVPELAAFEAPGYVSPVAGVWYGPGEAKSALPLGGLGTGFVDFTSAATFGENTTENTWLHPAPSAENAGLEVRVGEKTLELFPGTKDLPEAMRYWGHYPAADVDFGDVFGKTRVYLRAFAPVIPHDAVLSNTPAALFHFTVANHGADEAPVTLALQWAGNPVGGTNARGNVEGALGWRRDVLPPGAAWTVSPMLVFGKTPRQLRSAASPEDAAQLEGSVCPEGYAYASGGITDFFLDAFGGFNWETHRRESTVYEGAPNIGQLFWQLRYGAQKAGRMFEGPFGLSGDALPALTQDGALEVKLQVRGTAKDGVALAFTVTNVSKEPVRDLHFGIAVNVDLGGPKHAENQRAAFDAELGGILFEAKGVAHAAALVGDADEQLVSTWPLAHQALERGELLPVDAPPEQQGAEPLENGVLLRRRAGTYAVGAAPAQGWALEHRSAGPGVIRSQASRLLAPGDRAEVVLGLAWHFPRWTSTDGEDLRHRYAAAYDDAGAVLAKTLPQAPEIEARILDWQSRIYGSSVPEALQDAVINGLYILPRNAWWLDDGRFFQSESFTGCAITETFVCRFNGSFPLALLWPEAERATMRTVAAAQAESGEIPFGFGRAQSSRSPYYQCQHPIVSSEFVLTTWRNYALWKDEAYLEETYPAVKRALEFAMTLDKDGDGLINEDPGSERGFPANQYYDIWPWWGTSAYTGSIWLAALRAGEAHARQQGDNAFADELHSCFERGARAFDDLLWTGQYYRLYNAPAMKRRSETSLTNALCGQWFAYACGLGEIVPRPRIHSVIDTVLRLNAPATPYGAVNGVGPNGAVDTTFRDHSAVITIGEVWNFCAMAAFAGRKQEAIALFKESYENLVLRQKTPWNITWSLDRKTGALKWGWNYYSNPCVWTLFQALDAASYRALGEAPPG